ncbi:MAG: hypothetical protein JXR53_08565 [Bacteroidales bacterium]|nr:hypothetical protein [Bacteroidales bacterium]
MRIIVFILGVLSFSIAFSQNVGISNGVITPDVSAGLEVRYTDKGVLMPRVALTSVNDAATIPTPANSLFVYNTGAGGLVPAGYYYNEGTTVAPKWVRVANGTSLDDAWQLLGNAGTNPANNFLGTTDAQDLVFRTSNIERIRVVTNGRVGIGTPTPSQFVTIINSTPFSLGGSIAGVDNLYLEDHSMGAGDGNIGGSISFSGPYNGGGGAQRRHIAIAGVQETTESDYIGMAFYTHNSTVSTGNMQESMRLSYRGWLGVGTPSPGGKLEVNMANNDNFFQVRDDNNIGVEMRSGTSAGTPYFDFSNDATSDYDARLRLTGDDYLAIEGSRLGIGTTTPTEMLQVAGNANATGYITAGTASTGSITRYGSQTIKWEGGVSVHGTTTTYSIGTFVIPNNIPAGTTIYIDRIVWETDGYHTDGNENYSIYVNIGASGYYGWPANAGNGAMFIDWHYDSGPGSYTSFTTNQTVRMRLYDDDPWLGGSDDLRVFVMHATFYYHYTSPLQSGDIAASGRIYANNNEAVGDLAEHFEYSGPVQPGFVVSYVPGTDNEYVLCEEPYSNHITGVISENPSVVLNSPKQGPPLALAGRVNVKLIDSDELIKGGDFITSSAVAGYGMKATQPGPVIGYAVKNQKPGEDFVEILLQPGKFYVPPKYMDFDDRPDANDEKVNENYREPGGGAKQIGKTKN